jgi:hypothetical protein
MKGNKLLDSYRCFSVRGSKNVAVLEEGEYFRVSHVPGSGLGIEISPIHARLRIWTQG